MNNTPKEQSNTMATPAERNPSKQKQVPNKRHNLSHLNISNPNSQLSLSNPSTPTSSSHPSAASPPKTPSSPISSNGTLPNFFYTSSDFQIAQYLFAIVRIDNILHSLPKLVKKVSILNPLYKPTSPEATSFSLNNSNHNNSAENSKLGAIPCISYIALQTGFSFNLNSIPNDFLNEIFNNNKLPQDQLDNLKLSTLDNGIDTLIFKINQFNNDMSDFNLKSLIDYKETLILVQQLQRLGLLAKSYYQKKLVTHIKQRSSVISSLRPMISGNSRFAKLYSDVSFLSDILDPTDLFNLSNFYINVDGLSAFKNNFDDIDKAVQLTFSGLPVFLNLLHIYLKKLKATINPYHSYSFLQQKNANNSSNEMKSNLFYQLPYPRYTVHRLNAILLKILEVYTGLKRFNCLITALKFDTFLDKNIKKNDESMAFQQEDDDNDEEKLNTSILVNNDRDCINTFKVYLKKFDYCFSNEFEIIIYSPMKRFLTSNSSKTNSNENNNSSSKHKNESDLFDEPIDIEAVEKLISKVLRNFKLVVNVYNILKLLYNEYLILVNEEIELQVGASSPVATPVQESYPSNISSNAPLDNTGNNNTSNLHNQPNGTIYSSSVSASDNLMKPLESPTSDISTGNSSLQQLSKIPSLANSESFVDCNNNTNSISTNNLSTSINAEIQPTKPLSASSSPSKKNKNHLRIITKGLLSGSTSNDNIVSNNIIPNENVPISENDISPLMSPSPLQKWSRIGFLDRFSLQSTSKKFNSINNAIPVSNSTVQTPTSASSNSTLIRSSSAGCADDQSIMSIRKELSAQGISTDSVLDEVNINSETLRNLNLSKNEGKRHKKSSSTGLVKAIELSKLGKILNKSKDASKNKKEEDSISADNSNTLIKNDSIENKKTDYVSESKLLNQDASSINDIESTSTQNITINNNTKVNEVSNTDGEPNQQFNDVYVSDGDNHTISTHDNGEDSYEIEFRLEGPSHPMDQVVQQHEHFEEEHPVTIDQVIEQTVEYNYSEVHNDNKNGIQFELQIDSDSDSHSEEMSILSVPESKELYGSKSDDNELNHDDDDRSVDILSINKLDEDTDIKYIDDTTTDDDNEEDDHEVSGESHADHSKESILVDNSKNSGSNNTSRDSQVMDTDTLTYTSSEHKVSSTPTSQESVNLEENISDREHEDQPDQEYHDTAKSTDIVLPSILIEDANEQQQDTIIPVNVKEQVNTDLETSKNTENTKENQISDAIKNESIDQLSVEDYMNEAAVTTEVHNIVEDNMNEAAATTEVHNIVEDNMNEAAATTEVHNIVEVKDENNYTFDDGGDDLKSRFASEGILEEEGSSDTVDAQVASEYIHGDHVEKKFQFSVAQDLDSEEIKDHQMSTDAANPIQTIGSEPDMSKKLDHLNQHVNVLNEEIDHAANSNDNSVYAEEVLEFVRPHPASEVIRAHKGRSSTGNILESILDITSDATSEREQSEDENAENQSIVISSNDETYFESVPIIRGDSEITNNSAKAEKDDARELLKEKIIEQKEEDVTFISEFLKKNDTEIYENKQLETKQHDVEYQSFNFPDNTAETKIKEALVTDKVTEEIENKDMQFGETPIALNGNNDYEDRESSSEEQNFDNESYKPLDDADLNIKHSDNDNIKIDHSMLNLELLSGMSNKRDTFKVLDEDLKMIIEKIANFSDSELYEKEETPKESENKIIEENTVLKTDNILVFEKPNKLKKKKSIIIHHSPRKHGLRSQISAHSSQESPVISHSEQQRLYDLSDIISLISGEDIARSDDNVMPNNSEESGNNVTDSIEQMISHVDVRENESVIGDDEEVQSSSNQLSRKSSVGLLYRKFKENGSRSSVNITLRSPGNENEKDGRRSKVISKILDANEYSAILKFLNLEEESPSTPENIIIKNVGPSNTVVNVTRGPRAMNLKLTNNTAFQKSSNYNKGKQYATNDADYGKNALSDIEEDKRNSRSPTDLFLDSSEKEYNFLTNKKDDQPTMIKGNGLPTVKHSSTYKEELLNLNDNIIQHDYNDSPLKNQKSIIGDMMEEIQIKQEVKQEGGAEKMETKKYNKKVALAGQLEELDSTEGISVKTPSIQGDQNIITREEVAKVLQEIANSPKEPSEVTALNPKFEPGKDNIHIINTPPSPTTLPSTVGENNEIKLDLNKYSSSHVSNLFDYNVNQNVIKYNSTADLRMAAYNFYDSSQSRLQTSRQQHPQEQQIIFQSSFQDNPNINTNNVIVEEQLVGFHDDSSDFNIESPRSPDTSFGYLNYYDTSFSPRNEYFSNMVEANRHHTQIQQTSEFHHLGIQQQLSHSHHSKPQPQTQTQPQTQPQPQPQPQTQTQPQPQQSKSYNHHSKRLQYQNNMYSANRNKNHRQENNNSNNINSGLENASYVDNRNADNKHSNYNPRNVKNYNNLLNNISDSSKTLKKAGTNNINMYIAPQTPNAPYGRKQSVETVQLQSKTVQQQAVPQESVVQKLASQPPQKSQPSDIAAASSDETNPFNFMFADVPKRSERRTKNSVSISSGEKNKNHSNNNSTNSNEFKSPIISKMPMKYYRNDGDGASEGMVLRINGPSNLHGYQNESPQSPDMMFYGNKVPPQTAGLPFSDTTSTISNSKYGGDESLEMHDVRNANQLGANKSNLQLANSIANNIRSNIITSKLQSSSSLVNEGNNNSNNDDGTNSNIHHHQNHSRQYNPYDNIISPTTTGMMSNGGVENSRAYGYNEMDDSQKSSKNNSDNRYGSNNHFTANNQHRKKNHYHSQPKQQQQSRNYPLRSNNYNYISHDEIMVDDNMQQHPPTSSSSSNGQSGGSGPGAARVKLWGSKSRNASSTTNNSISSNTGNLSNLPTPTSATSNAFLSSLTNNNGAGVLIGSSTSLGSIGNAGTNPSSEPIVVVGGGNGLKLGKNAPKLSVFPKMSNSEGIGAIAAMKILEPITSDDKPITNGKKGDDGILWLDDRQIEAYNNGLLNMNRNSNGELDNTSIGDEGGSALSKNSNVSNVKGKSKNSGFRARFIGKHKNSL